MDKFSPILVRSSALTRLVFPVPEGALMINRLPDIAVILKLFSYITHSNHSPSKISGTVDLLCGFVDTYAAPSLHILRTISTFLFKILHLFTHLFNQHLKLHGNL